MKKGLKARWIAALRSGKYQQGAGALRDADNRFCCLGVLCDIVESRGWRQTVPGSWHFHDENTGHTDCAYAPAWVLSIEKQIALANMNDRDGKTFAEIADYIELATY